MSRTFLVITLFVAACGSSSAGNPGAASTASAGGDGSASDMECHDEVKTGSSLPRRVCRSKLQSDTDRQGAQDLLSQPRPSAGR